MIHEIYVDLDCINDGIPGSPLACPIAVAMERYFRKGCIVGEDVVYLDHFAYELPEEAKKFIREFDSDLPVIPIKFKFDDKR